MNKEFVKEELSNSIAAFIHDETNVLQTLINSMVETPNPKALELKYDDRVAVIYSQNGRIVHAIETDIKMQGEGFVGKDALLAVSRFNKIMFREFHCDFIQNPSLDLLAEEVFDRAVIEENMTLRDIAEMIYNYPYIELGLYMRSTFHGQQIFYTRSPENYGKLTQQMLSFIKKLIVNLQGSHLETPDNIQIKLLSNSFKTALIKQYADDYIILFSSKAVIDEKLKTSFNDF